MRAYQARVPREKANMKLKTAIAALTLLFAQSLTSAGSVEGPYIVWVNLAANPDPVNQELSAYLEQRHDDCWQYGGVLVGRDRPKQITIELVRKAILERDKPAIARLNKLLKQPNDARYSDGFDGIMVYTDQPKPTLYSMTVGPKKIRFAEIHPEKYPQYLGTKFCKIAPPITRSP